MFARSPRFARHAALSWLLVARNYGIALVLITTVALLTGQLSTFQLAADLLVDRGAETVIGALDRPASS